MHVRHTLLSELPRDYDALGDYRATVDRLREETATLFRSLGAASNQIGRTYPFREALSPPAEQLLAAIKAQLDPTGRMNPGVLGFAAEA
jgi:FAD/FMN-containing dehydrogenase